MTLFAVNKRIRKREEQVSHKEMLRYRKKKRLRIIHVNVMDRLSHYPCLYPNHRTWNMGETVVSVYKYIMLTYSILILELNITGLREGKRSAT